ncbi:hypothetical protein SMICM304S_07689 [Streptomyces microflavus]
MLQVVVEPLGEEGVAGRRDGLVAARGRRRRRAACRAGRGRCGRARPRAHVVRRRRSGSRPRAPSPAAGGSGPPLAEGPAPGQLRQHRRMEHVDIPGLGALAEQLADPARGWAGAIRCLIQCPKWSREGPDIEVKEAILPWVRPTVTNSQDCTDPQSCPTTWTGRSGLTASITARKSSVSFSRVKPPRSGLGAVDLPWSPDVVQHDVPVLGEPHGDLGPDLLAVRVSVHQHHRRPVRVAQFGDAELDATRTYPALARSLQTHAATFSSAQRRTCGRSSSSQKALCSGSLESVTTGSPRTSGPYPENPGGVGPATALAAGDGRRSCTGSTSATSRVAVHAWLASTWGWVRKRNACGGPAPFGDSVHLVGDDAEGVGPVPVRVPLCGHEAFDVLVDLAERTALAHLPQDQLAVRLQVRQQPVVQRVEAEAAGIADVGGISLVHRGHVEDERHARLQLPVGGEELERHLEPGERGAVPEPGEGEVDPHTAHQG